MTSYPARLLAAAALSAAIMFTFVLTTETVTAALAGASADAAGQDGAAAAQAPADQDGGRAGRAGRGGGRGGGGGGRGRGAPPELGDGPWDLDTELGRVHVTVVTKGLDTPWGMAFVPGSNDILVTERAGRLRVVRNGTLDPTPLGPLPEVYVAGLGGMLDVALHPDFASNRLVYFAYSKPDPQQPPPPADAPAGRGGRGGGAGQRATVAVARARWDGGSTLANVEDIFVADAYHGGPGAPGGLGPATGSYGTRLAFDGDGHLFVTLGERNYPDFSQDPSSHAGKILRLREDGSVPDDNPFIGTPGYKPEIYTLGHRNPLGLTIHPTTGELWSSEFGPRGGDEVNRILPGKNYGWYLVSQGMNYDDTPVGLGTNSKPYLEDPVLFWVPSIQPGNILFYFGEQFPQWRGNLLMATMSRSVMRATFDADGNPVSQERFLTELGQRFRDIRVARDGSLYLLTDVAAGAMLRVTPAR
jgi:glucose/arabinose dehydrogenase